MAPHLIRQKSSNYSVIGVRTPTLIFPVTFHLYIYRCLQYKTRPWKTAWKKNTELYRTSGSVLSHDTNHFSMKVLLPGTFTQLLWNVICILEIRGSNICQNKLGQGVFVAIRNLAKSWQPFFPICRNPAHVTPHNTFSATYVNTATGRTSLRRDGFVQVSLILNSWPEKCFPVQRNVLLLACRKCTVQTWTHCWNVRNTNGKPCGWNVRLRVGPQRSKKIAFNQKPKLLTDQYPRLSKPVITNVTVTTMTHLDELWIIYWLCRQQLYTDRKWPTPSLIRRSWFTLMNITQHSQTPIKNPRQKSQ